MISLPSDLPFSGGIPVLVAYRATLGRLGVDFGGRALVGGRAELCGRDHVGGGWRLKVRYGRGVGVRTLGSVDGG